MAGFKTKVTPEIEKLTDICRDNTSLDLSLYAKYDVKPNEIPLSIADMDFYVAPKIKEALLKRLELGSYGYVYPREDLFNAYNEYYLKMYNFDIKEARKAFSLGVLPSLSSLIKLAFPVLLSTVIYPLTPSFLLVNHLIGVAYSRGVTLIIFLS